MDPYVWFADGTCILLLDSFSLRSGMTKEFFDIIHTYYIDSQYVLRPIHTVVEAEEKEVGCLSIYAIIKKIK
jgi:hypothetical protein